LAYTKIDRLKRELDTAISEGDFEFALEVINDMIKIEHNNDQFWNSRGVVLSKLGRLEEAIQAFDQGLELNPEASRIWYSKGVVLMDGGKPRAALACFYKALDADPVYEKARERFNRCLDDLVLLKQGEGEEMEEEGPDTEPTHRAPTGTVPGPGEFKADEEEDEEEEEPEIIEPRAVKKKGTYLDDDMFAEKAPLEEEEEEEEWEEEEEEEEEDEEEEEEEEDEDEGEDEEWDFDEEEEEEEEEEELGQNFIVCRCGSKIFITSDKRPYRFECEKCGRSGTLKS